MPEELAGLVPGEAPLVHGIVGVHVLLHHVDNPAPAVTHILDKLLDDELYQIHPILTNLQPLLPDL